MTESLICAHPQHAVHVIVCCTDVNMSPVTPFLTQTCIVTYTLSLCSIVTLMQCVNQRSEV